MEDSKKFSKDICKIVGHDATTEAIGGGYCERCDPFPCRVQRELQFFVGSKVTEDIVLRFRSKVESIIKDAIENEELEDYEDINANFDGRSVSVAARIKKDGVWQIFTVQT